LEGRDEMLQQVDQVLKTGELVESEVLTREGRWFFQTQSALSEFPA